MNQLFYFVIGQFIAQLFKNVIYWLFFDQLIFWLTINNIIDYQNSPASPLINY